MAFWSFNRDPSGFEGKHVKGQIGVQKGYTKQYIISFLIDKFMT